MVRVAAAARALIGVVALAVVGAMPLAGQGREEGDVEAVREVARAYLDGLLRADTAVLRRVFAPGTRFHGVVGGALDVWDVEDWIDSRAGKRLEPEEDYVHRVTSVEVSGDAASVRVELSWPKVRFVDYLSLLRIGDEWTIVAKIWHQEPSPQAMARVEVKPLPSEAAERFLGHYATDESRFLIAAHGEEGLRLRVGERKYRLFFLGDATFAPEWDVEARIRFVEGGDSGVREVLVQQGDQTVVARPVPPE